MRQSLADIVLVEGNNELNVQMSPIPPLPEDYFTEARGEITDVFPTPDYLYVGINVKNNSPFDIDVFIGLLRIKPYATNIWESIVGDVFTATGGNSLRLAPGGTGTFYAPWDTRLGSKPGHLYGELTLMPRPNGAYIVLDNVCWYVEQPLGPGYPDYTGRRDFDWCGAQEI